MLFVQVGGVPLTKKGLGDGYWTKEEAQHHINYLELLAVLLALQAFSTSLMGKHVKVMIDNMTALTDINYMGTSK